MEVMPLGPALIEEEIDDALGGPLVPTIVNASFKGGVGKTTLSVTEAERLAMAGLQVLLVTCDKQEDARFRLGLKASDGKYPCRAYGSGAITVRSAMHSRVLDLLYTQPGPQVVVKGKARLFDVAVVDMPAGMEGGRMAGVTTVVPVDCVDAARNAAAMLSEAPASSQIMVVGTRFSPDQEIHARMDRWRSFKRVIAAVAPRRCLSLSHPLVDTLDIQQANDLPASIYSLPRSGDNLRYLQGVDTILIEWLHRAKTGFTLPLLEGRAGVHKKPHNPWGKGRP